MLNGANAAALRSGDGGDWEVIQFETAELIAPAGVSPRRAPARAGRHRRGRSGDLAGRHPLRPARRRGRAAGPAGLGDAGLERHYRVGPATRAYDHPSFEHRVEAFAGVGLRPYRPAHLAAERVRTGRSGLPGRGARGSTATAGRAPTCRWARSARPTSCASSATAALLPRGGRPSAPAWRYSADEQASDARRRAAALRGRAAFGPLRTGTFRKDRDRCLGPPSSRFRWCLPAQAQKHVTVNEALARLDAVAQLRVISSEETIPPAPPATARATSCRPVRPALGRARPGRSRSGATAAGSFSRRRLDGAPGTRAAGASRTFDGVAWVPMPSRFRPAAPRVTCRILEFDHAITAGGANLTAVAIPGAGAGARGDRQGGRAITGAGAVRLAHRRPWLGRPLRTGARDGAELLSRSGSAVRR